MAEQPVNLLTAIYLGVFSRAEQRVLQAIFKAIVEGGGRCVATLARLARDSNTSKSTTRNAITRAVEIGLLEKIERRPSCAVSLSNVLTYGKSHYPARPLILVVRVASPPSWICSRKGLKKGSVAFARAITRRADGSMSRISWLVRANSIAP